MADPPTRPYSGIRILDLTHELGGYAGRLFADLGGEVIRVASSNEEVGGSGREQQFAHAFLNANKRCIALDLRTSGGLEVLADLLQTAAIVLLEPRPGGPDLLQEVLASGGPRVVSVISYFGLTGPYSRYLGSDLVAQALGGIAWLSGEPDKPPLRIAGEQSRFVASLYAAAATAIAFWDAEGGERRHVLDISAQECIAHSLQNAIQVYDLEKRISTRGGEGTRDATEGVFACRDGYVSLAAPLALPASWNGLIRWMQDEGYAEAAGFSAPEWADRATRATELMRQTFRTLFGAFVANKTRQEVGTEALRRKIVMAPVSRLADLPFDPQLVFRRYFQNVHERAFGQEILFPGAPYRLSEPVWSIAQSATMAGEPAAVPPPRRACG